MDDFRTRFTGAMRERNFSLPLASLAMALILSAIPILIAGRNPIIAYYEMLGGAVGGPIRIGVSLTKATPIIFTGLSVALAFRSGLFNIGAEGQLYLGALGATLVALGFPDAPKVFLLPASIVIGFLFGAIWGVIPGYLKARYQTNEIITTIMMNYIAFWFISYLVHGPLREPNSMYSYTAEVPLTSRLPVLIPGTQLHAGFLIALVLVVITYILIEKTAIGFRLRATGANPEAAHYAGMSIRRNIILVMALSGGLAALAGVSEILGVQYRLSDFFSSGFGYDGVAVALLGNSNPWGVLLASLFFGLLRGGASIMQRRIGVPAATVLIIQGMAVFFVVIGVGFRIKRHTKVLPERQADGIRPETGRAAHDEEKEPSVAEDSR
jgi:simple sugar transport system permease protein